MQENRLPQNSKEGLLYGAVIAGITAFIMCAINVSLGAGRIDGQVIISIIYSFPLFFVLAMLMEHFVAGPFAEFMCRKFGGETDGFNACILFRIVFTVLGMSFIMTWLGLIYGELVSAGTVTTQVFTDFLLAWPRNFFLAFWIEILIAQPIARKVMKTVHARKQRSEIIEFTPDMAMQKNYLVDENEIKRNQNQRKK